jgi:hypothetical protein
VIDRFANLALLVAGAALFVGLWTILIGGFVVFYRGRRSPVTRALLVIAPLLLIDGLVAGRGFWSTLVFLVGFGTQCVLGAAALARGRGWWARRRLVASLLYAGSILATVAWLGGHDRLEPHGGDETRATLVALTARSGRDGGP